MSENLLTGIFDSGVGGLSVLKQLIPSGGSYIYFGDTKNLPYGNKSAAQIISFTREIIEFFILKGAKRVIMACNTSSALAYDTLKREFCHKIEIFPLIQTAAPYIAKQGGKIGIMATQATIQSQKYSLEILKNNPQTKVYELACPDFVKIVENNLYNEPKYIEYIEYHLKTLLNKGCEKIVLGCTHYPYLMPILTKFAPKEIFIDPAQYMKKFAPENKCPVKVEFYVSNSPETFRKNAALFMEISGPISLVEFKACVNA